MNTKPEYLVISKSLLGKETQTVFNNPNEAINFIIEATGSKANFDASLVASIVNRKAVSISVDNQSFLIYEKSSPPPKEWVENLY